MKVYFNCHISVFGSINFYNVFSFSFSLQLMIPPRILEEFRNNSVAKC